MNKKSFGYRLIILVLGGVVCSVAAKINDPVSVGLNLTSTESTNVIASHEIINEQKDAKTNNAVINVLESFGKNDDSPTEIDLSKIINDLEKRISALENSNTKEEKFALSEEHKDAYSVGLMVAQYANQIITEMKGVGTELDSGSVERGVVDGLNKNSLLESEQALSRINNLEKKTKEVITEKQAEASDLLRNIAKKSNTLKQSKESVWIGNTKSNTNGGLAISVEQTVRYYKGAQIGEPARFIVKNIKPSDRLIKTAIELVNDNGVVELYAMPSVIRDDISLPVDILPWDIIHVTFDVRNN